MSDLSSLRAELRELRKVHVKPVSRMKKGDISIEVNKLREIRETTPPVAAVPSAPIKELKSAVKTVKEAKKHEFPVAPSDKPTKTIPAPKVTPGKKKDIVAAKVTKAAMMKMLAAMPDDE